MLWGGSIVNNRKFLSVTHKPTDKNYEQGNSALLLRLNIHNIESLQ